MRTESLTLLLIALLAFACSEKNKHNEDHPGDRNFTKLLTKTKVDRLTDSVFTGYYEVYENRKTKGKKIKLYVMVMPSIDKDKILSPIFHFEGGPGSGATGTAGYYEAFPEFRKNRDVVLIDFRGTGKSSGLFCKSMLLNADNPYEAFDDLFPIQKVRDCYNELVGQVDLKEYSTTNAITDIDEIRNWLGYDKINLLGFSYGTRACQSYLHQYPQSIRSVIMFGPAPTFMQRPESFARDSQETWDLIYKDCMADSTCAGKYPKLKEEFAEVLNRLNKQPALYAYTDTTTKRTTTVTIRKGMFSELIRTIMYSVDGQRKLPGIIHEVYNGNFEPIVIRAINRSINYNEISDAFYLCVTCSEDVPFMDTTKILHNTTNTFLGDYRIRQELKACEQWTRYELEDDYLTPVQTSIPVLIFVGDHDPVTPPRWGTAMAQRMSNYKFIVMPILSHYEGGLSNQNCLSQSFGEFFDAPGSQFQMPCIEQMKPVPFF